MYVDDELKNKADLSVMRNDLSGKAGQANMDIRLNEKADPSYVNTELAKKADNSDIQTINTELNKKETVANVDSKVSKLLPLDGSKKMTGNLDTNRKPIVNLANSQFHQSFNAANVNFVNITVSDNNAFIETQYEKYVNDQSQRNVSSVAMKNDLSYIMNQTGQFSDEDNVDGKDLIDKDFSSLSSKKESNLLILI